MISRLLSVIFALACPPAYQTEIATSHDYPHTDAIQFHGREIRRREPAIAHPTLPVGSGVIVLCPRTGRFVVAIVRARGAVELGPGAVEAVRAGNLEPVILIREAL